jgi:hypothetical protein
MIAGSRSSQKNVGEAAVAAGLADGRAMGRDAAIAYALAGPVPA